MRTNEARGKIKIRLFPLFWFNRGMNPSRLLKKYSLCVAVWSLLVATTANAAEFLVYIGTYTGPKSKGIYAFRMDDAGKLAPLGLAAETVNPTFLALHPKKQLLYAISEIGDFQGKKAGGASAFSIDSTSGKLTLLNQESAGGDGPCHLIVDRAGKNLLLANYGGGSVASLPVLEDGRLGPATAFIQHRGSSVNPQRQKEPHGHCIVLDAANRFALACDLGLDKVLVYKFDPARGTLTPNDPVFGSLKPGAGPRHLAFGPREKFAYVINELDSTMTVFRYDAKRGALKEVQTLSTVPEDFKGNNSCAEVAVHPNGKFLYGSNRGHNSIVIFSLDQSSGKMKQVGHQSTQGKTPRNFAIDPTGRFLLAANQDSHDVFVFRVDDKTGALTPTGEKVEVGSPVCVQFVPVRK